MKKTELILVALTPAGDGVIYTPVQLQKLLFLIERRIETLGHHFKFKPYDYGPFDAAIYSTLDELSKEGLVDVIDEPELRWKTYRLTPKGLKRGMDETAQLPTETADYIK